MSTVKDEIQRISRSQSETVGELAKWSDLIDKIGAILAIVEAVLALILGGVLGKIPASVGYYYDIILQTLIQRTGIIKKYALAV